MSNIITFKWSMTEEGLQRLFTTSWPKDGNDLCGKVYFGNFALECIWDGSIQTRTGCYVLGWDNYDYWGNDPYGECDDLCITLPETKVTLAEFRDLVEAEILDVLKYQPDLLKEACIPTDISRWSSFPDHENYTHTVMIDTEVNSNG